MDLTVIGFVIVSHRDEVQLLRLLNALNRIYDMLPIACHHDSHQSAIDQTRFPTNVRFVDRPVKTGWGKLSIVRAALRGLQTLYNFSAPDWFVLLSAADFPIRPAELVLAELRNNGADAFIDFRSIADGDAAAGCRAATTGTLNPDLQHFGSAGNRLLKKQHYTGAQIWLPKIRRDSGRLRPARQTLHLPVSLPWAPYAPSFQCFYGDHWFTANKKVAKILLAPSPEHLRLQQHLAFRFAPDECYYQTVLCNDPSLVLHRDNKRFAEWNGGGAHPQELTENEWPKMFASGAHFARKFAEDDVSLSTLQQIVERSAGSTQRA